MGYVQQADFVADLDSSANHAWITGFGQNTPAAMAAGYGLATYLPTLMGSQYNHVDYMTPVPYTVAGPASPAGVIRRSTTQTLSGAASLQFIVTAAANTLQTRGPLMRCQEGRGYAVSMTWYKEAAIVLGEVDGVLSWFDSTKALLSTSLVCTFVSATDNQWTTTIDAATAPTGARYFTVGVAFNAGTAGGATGSLYVDEMLIDEVAGGVPVGTIVAWDEWSPNNRGGTPLTLPSGWKKCDGTLVTDKLSIFYNTTMANLNGTAAGAGAQNGPFLRGWNRSAGVPTIQAESVTNHTHGPGTLTVASHTHTIPTGTTAGLGAFFLTGTVSVGTVVSGGTAPAVNGGATASSAVGAGSETRPQNYGVTWIKRIR